MRLEVAGGHLIACDEGRRLLLDSGAPRSLGSGGALALAGQVFPTVCEFHGVTLEEIEGHVGVPLDALVGMDVLARFDVRLAVADLCCDFHPVAAEPVAGRRLTVEEAGGVPLLDATVDGVARRFVFDTGATISYLRDHALPAGAPGETVEDFYPGIGVFETSLRRAGVSLAGAEREMRFGALPRLLDATLASLGADGILGTEWLVDADAVLSMARRALWVRWR